MTDTITPLRIDKKTYSDLMRHYVCFTAIFTYIFHAFRVFQIECKIPNNEMVSILYFEDFYIWFKKIILGFMVDHVAKFKLEYPKFQESKLYRIKFRFLLICNSFICHIIFRWFCIKIQSTLISFGLFRSLTE